MHAIFRWKSTNADHSSGKCVEIFVRKSNFNTQITISNKAKNQFSVGVSQHSGMAIESVIDERIKSIIEDKLPHLINPTNDQCDHDCYVDIYYILLEMIIYFRKNGCPTVCASKKPPSNDKLKKYEFTFDDFNMVIEECVLPRTISSADVDLTILDPKMIFI